MKKLTYITIVVFAAMLLSAASDISFVTELKSLLTQHNKHFPQEKTYVQTDKTYYKPGEQIWYKINLVSSNTNKASHVSDVAYIELLDAWGNTVQKKEHNTISGTCNGMFQLANNAAGGIYKIKAYTRWMQNWTEETYFSKELTVQKVITPRLLLKLDFEKRAYGAGDEVIANLKVSDLNDVKTTGSIVKSTVRIGGKTVQTLENTTSNGELAIRFTLPQNLNTADGILQIVVSDKGTEESITRSIPIVLEKIQLNFYPEGGDLVENVQTKLAFEALNEFGKGADVNGKIVDEQGNMVTVFESFHLGMGAFDFTPNPNKKYFAKIISPAGNDDLFPLPEAKKSAYSLNLKSKTEKRLKWNIYSPKTVKNAVLTGMLQGEIYFSKELNLKSGYNTVDVPVADFPIGIAVFTLFDEKGTEQCERLVFVNENKGLRIEFECDSVFAPSDLASIHVKTSDENGKPIAANLGFSVVDEQLMSFADDKQDNIMSYLLFSSELKGKIQEPSFYFDKTEPKAKEAIDYLMLTHGWRRFTWDDIRKKENTVEIKFLPEKISSIYGYVLNKNGNPVQADVYLIEAEGQNRIAKVQTTREGHFVFHNVDLTSTIFVTTKLPNQLFLFKGKPITFLPPQFIPRIDENGELIVPTIEDVAAIELVEPAVENFMLEEEVLIMPEFDFGDIDALDEVVVVGYGTQKKQSLTGSIASVVAQEVITLPVGDISTALAGRVAGVVMGAAANEENNIRIRGISSVMSAGEPLVIINGIPVAESYSGALSLVNPNSIESITVMKDASATAVYGSRAANGVIIVETKKRFRSRQIVEKPEYGGVFVNKRVFYNEPTYTQAAYNPTKDNSTVYWNGNLQTDKDGKAKITFNNNEQSSAFRITAEGFSPASGLIGMATKRIVTRKPLSVDMKIPVFAGVGDMIHVPVRVRNESGKDMNVEISFEILSSGKSSNNIPVEIASENKKFPHTEIKTVHVKAKEAQTIYIPVKAKDAGECSISVAVRSEKNTDQKEQKLFIRRIDFPYNFSFSARDSGQVQHFILPEIVPGSLKAEAVTYSFMIDELFDGLESIFREPYGCFEQVSSTTFPNIFAMQLLIATGQEHKYPDVYKKALGYLENGYKKLAAYEIKGGGFEWFGKEPAHTGLTAYGIIEFYEMQKVYSGVNEDMMKRTHKFLLDRKDGKGGFHNSLQGYDKFSGSPKTISDAYITYALSETENAQHITEEYKYVLKEALSSEDMYRMALVANSAHNVGDKENYEKLIGMLRSFLKRNSFPNMKIQTTIVRTQGDAKPTETAALWLLALLKNKEGLDMDLVEKALSFINSKRRNGGFGNPQATSLCLQALTKYTELSTSNKNISGTFSLLVNGALVDSQQMQKNKKLNIDFTNNLQKGNNPIQVKYENATQLFPYSLNISWQAYTPASSALCPIKLSTKLERTEIKVNETVRLTVKMENTENTGQPMSVAIIGIPGGLSLQPWQLKELQEKEVYDFYEIIDDNLVIYYRESGPRETKIIELDLKAEIPGTYKGMASSAYIYYMNEHKHWVDGFSVRVME